MSRAGKCARFLSAWSFALAPLSVSLIRRRRGPHTQMLFDIEQAYNEFFRSLSGGSSNGGESGS